CRVRWPKPEGDEPGAHGHAEPDEICRERVLGTVQLGRETVPKPEQHEMRGKKPERNRQHKAGKRERNDAACPHRACPLSAGWIPTSGQHSHPPGNGRWSAL